MGVGDVAEQKPDIVLEELDPETNSIIACHLITRAAYENLDWLAFAEEDLQSRRCNLSAGQADRLKFQLSINSQYRGVAARAGNLLPGETIGVNSHTNRELLLMLKGKKPMAVFSDAYPNRIGAALYADQPFEQYVEQGVINRTLLVRKADDPIPEKGYFSFFRDYYTLPGEEWRIAEYENLWDGKPWTHEKERREGELLGYTDEENDGHIERMRAHKPVKE